MLFGYNMKADELSQYKYSLCEICDSKEADYLLDPYQAEIHNNEIYRWLCEYCYRELQQDI